MRISRTGKALFLFLLLFSGEELLAQKGLWHNIQREIHYQPEGEDFLLVKGRRRFNRALYGSNTAFRAEAGDLPEFALYLPGMGGNLKFGFIRKKRSKWLIEADHIQTRYQPGSMLYTIKDSLLGEGTIRLTALPSFESEGFMVKVEGYQLPEDVKLLAFFGGATGQKFSRDGDIGADPESSFYLKPEYCKDNVYHLNKNQFTLYFGSKKPLSEKERYELEHLTPQQGDTGKRSDLKILTGVFPAQGHVKRVDAAQQESPFSLFASDGSATPAIATEISLIEGKAEYIFLHNGKPGAAKLDIAEAFTKAEKARKQLAGRIKVNTPDPYINTVGGALSIAADAIWDDPSYMHGAVAWRMRLPGWRGAYVADVLGWHDRARKHFNAYALSQVTSPTTGPVVMDTALHLARGLEKMGTAMFSSGYLPRNPGGDQRPHHYDMNLVFVDQLLNHFMWTGDTAYVKQMWPLLVRHLDWEKRNFDTDGDGLYDAYAAIWASDALQYSGGGVAHSSAYNYRANKVAAKLAKLIGENGERFEKEAAKILQAINSQLWLTEKGWLAEYKDLLGEKLVHPAAGLWTIYHAIDSRVPDPFQAYQVLKYVDAEIPRIPVRAQGLTDTTLYTLSTTNWQPYTWSLNNVAPAELLHTALAYWQGGRQEEAYQLWKSTLVESMYLGASPGNFQQLSFYDAARGELYRDFADVIGMAGRSLVEGLFGIQPDLLHHQLHIKPGLPAEWEHASLETPDVSFTFQRKGDKDLYQIKTNLTKHPPLIFRTRARMDDVEAVLVNGKSVQWKFDSSAIGEPVILFQTSAGNVFAIEIVWKGNTLEKLATAETYRPNAPLSLSLKKANFINYYDPQKAMANASVKLQNFKAVVKKSEGTKTFFLQVKQGNAVYWLPVSFAVKNKKINASAILKTPVAFQLEKVDLAPFFNDDVKNIFKNQYLSPRPNTTTLQLPIQGIGNWAYPLTTANIDDSGLRQKAGEKNEFVTGEGIPFATPSAPGTKNVLFTSQWSNYPKQVTVPLSGKAGGAYLLMAGSTNPMQSRITNGEVVVQYTDGSSEKLELKNPENWWPIEQDYYLDDHAFNTGAPKPLRVYLKRGEDTKTFNQFTTIKGFSNRGIDGGAATVLEMSFNPQKSLKSLTLRTIANDVVIGLMSVTLVRTKN